MAAKQLGTESAAVSSFDSRRVARSEVPRRPVKNIAGQTLSWPDAARYEAALLALARELDRVTEKEREKLAEQLHDGFGQELILTKLKLSELAEALPRKYRDSVDMIIGKVNVLIRQTRTVLDDLYAQRVSEIGLKAAVQSAVTGLTAKHGLACTLELGPIPKQLKGEVEEKVFRAVRELLVNVVKHAGASQVQIRAARTDGRMHIEVSDNGCGFNRDQTLLSGLSGGRFGLFSVRASLRSIGATLRIFSRSGQGTRAVIILPVDAKGPQR